MTERWSPPTPRAAELIRATAQRVLDDPGALFAEMDQAVLGAVPALATDVVIAAETRASNRANVVRWLSANAQRPGAAVGPDLTPEALDVARDVVRRGLDREALLTGYRQGQNIAWRGWMQAATVTADATGATDALGEVLDVTARSLFAFVDDILAGVDAQMARERDQLVGGTLAQRRETVSLVLEGAPITEQRAGARLGYELAGGHTALVLWSEERVPDQGVLERTADLLARAAGARRPFTMPAGSSMLWAWFAGDAAADPAALHAALQDAPPGVLAAAGSHAAGIAGFRRSHQEALAAQRLLMRRAGRARLITYDEVQIVVLAASDEERAAQFITATLGELAQADAELRQTLRVYLQEQSSASRAARVLFTHRNTVINRVARAEHLLPRPLAARHLSVALALELRHWLAWGGS
ncbi:MAG: PucR family transcriptional regulator [Solirubrobacterales bacterium]|jgi:DNA-binding PucR family transcriptional regulator|nr:PucR family transcriptional regulator [Solirubrobacterales bacterium]